MDQRFQALLFPPPISSLLTRKSEISSYFSTQLKTTQALSKSLSLKWSKFISLQRNWKHLNLFLPLHSLGYPNILPHFGFWVPRTMNRYDIRTESSLQGTPVKFRGTTVRSLEQLGAEEPIRTSQGLIRLLQPNWVPLMNDPRWFLLLCPHSALLEPLILALWGTGHFRVLQLQPWAWLPSVTTLTCATLESPASRAAHEWDCWGYRAHKPGVTLHKWVDCAVQLFYFNKIKNMHSTCSASI